jgi:DNA-binding NarL/FixJ family response regulator
VTEPAAPPPPGGDRTLPLLWVEIVSAHDVVSAGLQAIIQAELGSQVFTTVGPVDGEPDVIFYDVIGLHEGDGADLDHWVKETASTVIAVTRELRPDLAALAFEKGAEAGIPIGVSAQDLVETVQAVMTGSLEDASAVTEAADNAHPGSEAGLSPRESTVLGRVVQGLSNQEIAEELFLSINSVKTYIRSTYRKIDAVSRAQAVAWGIQHGFPISAEQAPSPVQNTP